METIANTYDDIITRSYEEYYQVILTYITYRITHRYEAEDLTKMYLYVCWTTNKCSVQTL